MDILTQTVATPVAFELAPPSSLLDDKGKVWLVDRIRIDRQTGKAESFLMDIGPLWSLDCKYETL